MFTNSGNQCEKTPYEVMFAKKPHMEHPKRFGSRAYVHVPKERIYTELEARARVGILVRYGNGSSCKLLLPELKRFVSCRDTQFDESIMGTNQREHELTQGIQRLEKPNCRQRILDADGDLRNTSKQNEELISLKMTHIVPK